MFEKSETRDWMFLKIYYFWLGSPGKLDSEPFWTKSP